MPETDLPDDIIKAIQESVANGSLDGLTVDVDAKIVYTFKKDGRQVSQCTFDLGSQTNLDYASFALVQGAHLKGANLILCHLNAATQAGGAAVSSWMISGASKPK